MSITHSAVIVTVSLGPLPSCATSYRRRALSRCFHGGARIAPPQPTSKIRLIYDLDQ
jgi:hypothetical protein